MTEERDLIAEARERRKPLHDAAEALELAAAAPAGTGDVWRNRLRDVLDQVEGALDDHVAKTEGPEGLYAELQQSAPRLSNDIALLTKDHIKLRAAISRVRDLLDADDRDVDAIREAIVDLLGRIVRHRQKGADLVYEAYSVDIGGEGL
jgi:chromosome segregation ATPase